MPACFCRAISGIFMSWPNSSPRKSYGTAKLNNKNSSNLKKVGHSLLKEGLAHLRC